MGARRVAPSSIIRWQSIVRRAEISRRNENGGAPRVTPLRIIGTFDLETSPAALAVVEEGSAQRCRLNAVSLAVKVPVATRPTCIQKSPIYHWISSSDHGSRSREVRIKQCRFTHGAGGVASAVKGCVCLVPCTAGIGAGNAGRRRRN